MKEKDFYQYLKNNASSIENAFVIGKFTEIDDVAKSAVINFLLAEEYIMYAVHDKEIVYKGYKLPKRIVDDCRKKRKLTLLKEILDMKRNYHLSSEFQMRFISSCRGFSKLSLDGAMKKALKNLVWLQRDSNEVRFSSRLRSELQKNYHGQKEFMAVVRGKGHPIWNSVGNTLHKYLVPEDVKVLFRDLSISGWWGEGDFADDGSCYWNCYSATKDIIYDNNGMAVNIIRKEEKYFDTGLGRCIVMPIEINGKEYPVLYNTYYYDDSVGDLMDHGVASMITKGLKDRGIDIEYKEVNLNVDGGETDYFYLNTGSGVVLYPSENWKDFIGVSDYDFTDLNIQKYFSNYEFNRDFCELCGDSSSEIMRYPLFNIGNICTDCYEEGDYIIYNEVILPKSECCLSADSLGEFVPKIRTVIVTEGKHKGEVFLTYNTVQYIDDKGHEKVIAFCDVKELMKYRYLSWISSFSPYDGKKTTSVDFFEKYELDHLFKEQIISCASDTYNLTSAAEYVSNLIKEAKKKQEVKV